MDTTHKYAPGKWKIEVLSDYCYVERVRQHSLYNNLRNLIIGKVYTSQDLAFYNQGDKFPKVIVTNINSSIDSVLLPTMAASQDDCDRVRQMMRRAILSMLMIVAHHYVVNSGLLDCIEKQARLGVKDYFLLLFGWGGKTGIDCFVLITGYFMCTSNITKKKFCKLLGEVYFYRIAVWCLFFFSGYESFSIKDFLKMFFPFFTVADNFTGCFLLFYLLIPFLNKLIHVLTEKEHFSLMMWCLGIYVVLPSFAKANVTFNYVTWFSILYIIASYIRLYKSHGKCVTLTSVSLAQQKGVLDMRIW